MQGIKNSSAQPSTIRLLCHDSHEKQANTRRVLLILLVFCYILISISNTLALRMNLRYLAPLIDKYRARQ